MGYDIVTQTFGPFPSYVLKYNALVVGERFSPHLLLSLLPKQLSLLDDLQCNVKVKVKCTLVQALRLCTGRTAHRGNRGIAILRLCTGRTAHKGSRGIAVLFHDQRH